ncbi:MAG: DUF1800 domain-containing protein [Blastocatellia bacterium]|nr:DUF1800 domain-containing protein [Blastocatellia bacterium]
MKNRVVGKRVVAGVLAALLGFSSAGQLAGSLAAQEMKAEKGSPKTAVRKLTQEQKTLHLLDRATYGIRPGDLERVTKMGWEKFLEEQMRPERIADVAVEEKLKGLESIHMSTAEMVKTYPQPQVLREALKAKGIEPPIPGTVGAAQPGAEPPDPKQAAENFKKLRQYRDALAEMGYKPQQQVVQELQQARILRAAYSERQLQEVMTDFWFNHFNIFVQKGADRILTTAYERDVIRPRVFGKFEDLLKATAESPAMLFYLDNWMSAAPAAAADLRRKGDAMPVNRRRDRGFDRLEALRGRRAAAGRVDDRMDREQSPAQPPLNAAGRIQRPARGLNENYAREIMELHTLGVDGGYTQKDVQEVARCFTGWTLRNPRQGGEFLFNPRIHDDGEKIVLGKKIAAGGGVRDGYEVIHLLATHPATAKFVSTKLARKFVTDEPPRALVDRMAETFRKTDGDLRQVLMTMFKSQEFWAPENYRAKIKTPFEMTVSAVRAIGADTNGGPQFHRWMAQMGEGLFLAQPPTGYPDTAEHWVNSGALLQRMNFALALSANRIPGTRVALSAPANATKTSQMVDHYIKLLLRGDVSPQTRATIDKSLNESQIAANGRPAAGSGFADAARVAKVVGLILGSPEFQRQ